MKRARLIMMLVIAGWASASAAAEPDDRADPPVETSPDEVPIAPARGPLSIDYMAIDLQVEAEFERRTTRSDRVGLRAPRFGQTNRRSRFEESMGLETRGSLTDREDRRWLDFDVMGRFGLAQERFVERAPTGNLSESPDSTLLEYDLSLELFPEGKLSTTAFASNLNDRIQRAFLPSLDRRRERYGGGVFFHDTTLPMELTFEHVFEDVTSNSRTLLDDEQRAEDTLRYEATWQPTEYHSLSLEYEYQRTSDQYSGTPTTFDTERNYLALNDVIQFGPDHRSRLDTLLRIEDERGDLARDEIEFSPRLRLQHTESLYTTTGVQFLKQSFSDLDTNTQRGDWSITHEYDDALTSTFGIYGLRQDTNLNSDTTEWGAQADFSYARDNDYGRFSSDLSFIHSDTQTNDGRRGGIVNFESVTFQDPLPVQLSQRDVNVASITVWNADRTQRYLPGRDYTPLPVGNVMTLSRVRTGRIADRETVLVSYTYRTFNDYHVSRDRMDLRLQQKFDNGVDVYYALSLQDEDIDRDRLLAFDDRNINRHRIGATYRKPQWSTGVELEFNDDSIDPFIALHTNGDVSIVETARHQLSANGNYSIFRFDGRDFFEPRQTSLLDLGLSYRYLFNQDLEANASAMYRYETDTLFGETQGVDLSASVVYKFGQFSLIVEAEYDALDLPSSTDNTAALWVKVRRDIPVIGARQW